MNPNEQAVAEAYAILQLHANVLNGMVLSGGADNKALADQFNKVVAARDACLKLQPAQKAA